MDKPNHQLKILQWNARGISNISTVKQLSNLLKLSKSEIVFLCETFLKDLKGFHLDNYKIYRRDRITHGGGVAIAIKNGIKQTLLPVCDTDHIENISVGITLNNKPTVSTSAYCPYMECIILLYIY